MSRDVLSITEMSGHHPHFGKWDTRDELHFLERLGTWTHGRFLGRRLALLRGYRSGLDLRRDWTGLDQAAITAEADRAIGREIRRHLEAEKRPVSRLGAIGMGRVL